MEQSVYEWLPIVDQHHPGITPFNVWDLTLRWWELYVSHAHAVMEAREKAAAQRA